YRRMAADTIDQAARLLGKRAKCRTRRLRLLGADGFVAPDRGDEPSVHEHLGDRYGTEADQVLGLLREDPSLRETLVPGLPSRRPEAIYAARREMAPTLADVLSRRTRARLLARDGGRAAAADVARLLAPELGWDEARVAREVDEYRSGVDRERGAAQLPET